MSILFHYGVTPAEVDILIEEGIDDAAMFQEANPDGDDDQQRAFELSVKAKIKKPVRLNRIRRAFRRINSADPMAAVSAAAAAAPAVAVSLAATSKRSSDESSSKSAKKAKKSSKDDGLSDISDDDANDGDDKDDDDDDDDTSKRKLSNRNDLNSLFDDVRNEVRFVLLPLTV